MGRKKSSLLADRGAAEGEPRRRSPAWLATLMGSSALVTFPGMSLADCVNTGGSSYLCSGAETASQSVSADNATITTAPDFSVDTPDPIAFSITGNGLIYFQGGDADLKGGDYGMNVSVGGDDGGVPGGLVLLTAGDLYGGEIGLRARNDSSGPTAISTDGYVEGGVRGIQINNGGDTTGLSLYTHGVKGGDIGINAQHYGGGIVTISAQGQVTGTNWYGIAASNNPMSFAADGRLSVLAAQAVNPPTDVIVRASAGVTGGLTGLLALNGGMGVLQVDTLGGAVTGATRDGIVAMNGGLDVLDPTDMWVTASMVNGARHGIVAMNKGSGTNHVAAYGAVVGDSGYGIAAANGNFSSFAVVNDGDVLPLGAAAATDLVIEAIDVEGGLFGIGANNLGTGVTSVTATGSIQGGEGGIYAYNGATATDLTISAADVSGGSVGIYSQNLGTGETVITTTGVVRGNAGSILAMNGGTATDLTVNAAEVSGSLGALNGGTGRTAIRASGSVDGGILAFAGEDTTGLVIEAADVSSGIAASNGGTGATSITATGTVRGGNVGIVAINDEQTTSLTISAADVHGAVSNGGIGIGALSEGTGATSITATGSVTGGLAGIYVQNGAMTTDLTVRAADVSGGTYGIFAVNGGAGATTLRTGGTVIGADAVFARGSTIDLTNDGTLVGRVVLDSADTTFRNNGTWNGAGGTSVFTGAASRLVSTGSVIGGTAAGLAETTTWSGLRQFTTQGVVALADGGSGDVLTTTGDVEFAAGSVLSVDVGGAAGADLFLAQGAVDLAGATLEATLSGPLEYGQLYAVLTAQGGLTGTFDDLVVTGTNPSAFLTVTDTYDATHAYLAAVQFRHLADAALTPNQRATAGALDALGAGAAFEAVVGSTDDASARFAFDQLSGEIHASLAGSFISDSRVLRDAATSRIRQAFRAPAPSFAPVLAHGPGRLRLETPDPERGSVWGLAPGTWSDRDGDGNTAAVESDARHFLIGADRLIHGWRAGVLGGYSHSSSNVRDRASSGSADSWHLGLYGGTAWRGLAFRTGVIHSWHDVTTRRTAAFPGFYERLDADYTARTLQFFGELAYGLEAGPVAFEPFAGLAYVRHHGGAYAETGGAAALSSSGSVMETTFATLGLRGETGLALGAIEGKLRGSIAWQHAFGDLTPKATQAFAGGGPFTVAGAPLSENSALVEFGLDLALTPTATVGLGYGGQFSNDVRDHSLRANLQIRF